MTVWLPSKACTSAKVKTTPPITTVRMPSVADTVKLPPTVSLLAAASEPFGLRPDSYTR
ncbi:hypothetical protein D3C84_1260750 [compost metagenome]